MPRKGRVARRKLAPDSRTGDPLVAKFINSLMYDGKKSKAEKIFYGSLEKIKEKNRKRSP